MRENKLDKKEITITFVPGCFDDFEGTQEELDEMVAEIQRMADSGELFDDAQIIDIDELSELAEGDEDYQIIFDKLVDQKNGTRRLN